jgi:sugar/nucleoside kinase (ribokinase family)
VRSGIIAGGNWIRDHVKIVDAWPAQDGLANILSRVDGNGGGPYNLLKDLSRLGAPFPLEGIGLVGDDADGRAILADCTESRIDPTQVCAVADLCTSYTDVIAVNSTGRRTFFHDRGANARLGPKHFDFTRSQAKIFYLGYLLLLDRLDAPGRDGFPAARDVLASARKSGLLTAVDCVSAAGGGFQTTVAAVLPEVDVLFVNDFEAEQITGVAVGRGRSLDRVAVEKAARALVGLGVRGWAVVHFPEGAGAVSSAGDVVWQAAVRLPPELIQSSVGAGDALAAGVLFGLHEGWSMERALGLAVCASASSLLHPTCSDGVLPLDDCLALGKRWGLTAFP